MPTSYADRTNLDAMFKNFYEPRIQGQYHKDTPLLSRIRKRSKPHEFTGKKAIIAAKYRRSQATAAVGESGSLPTAGYPRFANMEVDVAYQYGTIKATRPSMKASRNSAGAWAQVLTELMDDIREAMNYNLARQICYGDGTGRLAQVNGAVAQGATTVTVDNPGTRFLQPDMYIDIVNSAGVQQASLTGLQVASITSSTQFVLSAGVVPGGGITDNHYIVRAGSAEKECMGIGGIADDGTRKASLQGINRTTVGNEWLQSNLLSNGSTNRPLTLDLIDQAYLEAEINGEGGHPSAIYSKHVHQLRYSQLLRAERQFSAERMTLDGGWESVKYTGPGGSCDWIADRLYRDNEIGFICEEDLGFWELTPLEFVDDDGQILKWVTGKDEFEAYMASYGQLGAHRGNRHTVLQQISES